jgi:hypothetical protein
MPGYFDFILQAPHRPWFFPFLGKGQEPSLTVDVPGDQPLSQRSILRRNERCAVDKRRHWLDDGRELILQNRVLNRL